MSSIVDTVELLQRTTTALNGIKPQVNDPQQRHGQPSAAVSTTYVRSMVAAARYNRRTCRIEGAREISASSVNNVDLSRLGVANSDEIS